MIRLQRKEWVHTPKPQLGYTNWHMAITKAVGVFLKYNHGLGARVS